LKIIDGDVNVVVSGL